jgi:hypothetical protein
MIALHTLNAPDSGIEGTRAPGGGGLPRGAEASSGCVTVLDAGDPEAGVPPLCLGGSLTRIAEAVAAGQAAWRPFRGYASWAPQQLDGELEDGVWIACEAAPAALRDVVFGAGCAAYTSDDAGPGVLERASPLESVRAIGRAQRRREESRAGAEEQTERQARERLRAARALRAIVLRGEADGALNVDDMRQAEEALERALRGNDKEALEQTRASDGAARTVEVGTEYGLPAHALELGEETWEKAAARDALWVAALRGLGGEFVGFAELDGLEPKHVNEVHDRSFMMQDCFGGSFHGDDEWEDVDEDDWFDFADLFSADPAEDGDR